jgi:recombinational DNA repair protein RecR
MSVKTTDAAPPSGCLTKFDQCGVCGGDGTSCTTGYRNSICNFVAKDHDWFCFVATPDSVVAMEKAANLMHAWFAGKLKTEQYYWKL